MLGKNFMDARKPDLDPDLLEPTLTAADDAVGFDRPWNPNHLVFFTFFFGLAAGGGLLAFNFRRLGQKERFVPILAISLVVVVLSFLVLYWLSTIGMLEWKNASHQRTTRYARRAVAVIAALWIAHTQKKRYRLFQMSGSQPGKLLWPAVIAAIAGSGFEFLAGAALVLGLMNR